MNNRKNRKTKSKKINTNFVIFCALIFLAGIIFYKSAGYREQKEALAVETSELEEQLKEAKEQYKKLEDYEAYMKTKSYVEDVARNQLGLVYPDEIVIRPEE